ncbi:MAG: hypothetical protein J6L87_02680 [Clostridia bacterium]|nr:hypothetical protein [Clostridia bacterium]
MAEAIALPPLVFTLRCRFHILKRERGDRMQLDRNMLNKLLSLNDKQLEAVVRRFGEEYGLDLSQFHVMPGNMESLRQALRTATDEELLQLRTQLGKGGRRP